MSAVVTHFEPAHFINRELSWLEFNQRVLNEARDPANPLLERLKFFCIAASNLDEFFEVRVAGLKQQIESGVTARGLDGSTPAETWRAVQTRVRRMARDQYVCWRRELVPALAKNGIRFLLPARLPRADLQWLENYFRAEVLPVLTPLAIDPKHSFPQLLNKSLNIIVQVEMKTGPDSLRHLAVVPAPRVLPPVVRLAREGREGRDYVFLGRLIGFFLREIFPGAHILGHWHFRVTRNSELYIDEQDMGSLLKAVENELHNRRKGEAVRLEIDHDCPEPIRKALLGTLRLTRDDLYLIDGPLSPARLMALYEGDHSPELRDKPFAPVRSAAAQHHSLFHAIRQGDILLHHPYQSFGTVVAFLQQAAQDPEVLAIKLTLYRTGGDTRIVGALMQAATNGKQVTAVVELRARFDEANNIEWSRKLEEAGVHVVYGLVGYKIHCKMCLVVRKEDDAIRRYVHLSTGNYNPTTARLYTDLGLLTCRPDFGEDATNLFNLLTGIGRFQPTRKLLVSPFQLRDRLLQLIGREADNARLGRPARVIAKMNALLDNGIIQALYRASQAGVKIDLLVRGICSLRPEWPGLSDRITVRSVVDRFLEHSRVFYFENDGSPDIFLGSPDWMPRNFFRRIETVFPIEDPALRERVKSGILDICLADNLKSWHLRADGGYERRWPADEPPRRSQLEFIK